MPDAEKISFVGRHAHGGDDGDDPDAATEAWATELAADDCGCAGAGAGDGAEPAAGARKACSDRVDRDRCLDDRGSGRHVACRLA